MRIEGRGRVIKILDWLTTKYINAPEGSTEYSRRSQQILRFGGKPALDEADRRRKNLSSEKIEE